MVVRDDPWYTQPQSDGTFSLAAVPPGTYTLHAWHERAGSDPAGRGARRRLADLTLALDARGYRFKPHLNKFGQPYPQQGRRY